MKLYLCVFLHVLSIEEKTVPVEPTTSTTTFGPPVGAVVAAVKEMLTNYSNENLPARDLSEPIRAYVDFFFVGINGLDEVSRLTGLRVSFHEDHYLNMTCKMKKKTNLVLFYFSHFLCSCLCVFHVLLSPFFEVVIYTKL